MKSRTLRIVGSITALLAGLFWLERAWEIWDMKGDPLARYGNLLTGPGVSALAEILVRLLLGAVLLWLFVRLGSSKPRPRLSRRAVCPAADA